MRELVIVVVSALAFLLLAAAASESARCSIPNNPHCLLDMVRR